MSTLFPIFEWVVAATLRASVLVLVILVIQRLLGSRLSAKWKYALWLPVLAALLIPAQPLLPQWARLNFQPNEELTVIGFHTPEKTDSIDVKIGPELREKLSESTPSGSVGRAAENETGAGTRNGTPSEMAELSNGAPIASESQSRAEAPTATVPTRFRPRVWQTTIVSIWLIGFVCLATAVLLSYRLTLRRIRRHAIPPDESQRLQVEMLAQKIGLRYCPQLLLSHAAKTPAVCGLWRPVLLLNADFFDELTREEADFVLNHELMHLRRGDVYLNNFLCLILALHWFNPLLWYAFLRVKADRELACDFDVLRGEEPQRRVAYGKTLLKLKTVFRRPGIYLSFVGMLQENKRLRERIEFISYPKRMGLAMKSFLSIGMVLFAVLGIAKATEPQIKSVNLDSEATEPPVDLSTNDRHQEKTKSISFKKLESVSTRDQDEFTRARIAVDLEQRGVISRNHIRSGGVNTRPRIRAYLWKLDSKDPKRTRLPDSTTFGFVPKSNLAYTVNWGKGIRFWDTRTHKKSGDYIQHELREDTTMGPAISPSGKILVARSQMNHLRFWNISTRAPITSEIKQDGTIYGMKFSSNGKWFFSKTGKHLTIWQPETGKRIAGPFPHDIYSYIYSSKTNRIVTFDNNDRGEADWNCRVSIRSGESFTKVDHLNFFGHAREANWIDDQHILLVADDKDPNRRRPVPFRRRIVYLVSLKKEKPEMRELMRNDFIRGAYVAPDRNHFIVRTRDETSCWKLGKQKPIWTRVGDPLVSFGDKNWVLLHDDRSAIAVSLAEGKKIWRKEDVDYCRVFGSKIWLCNKNGMEIWRAVRQ